MSKEELIRNCTIEELAEMVVRLESQERTDDNYTMFLQEKLGEMEIELQRKESMIAKKAEENKHLKEQLQRYEYTMMQVDDVLVEFFGVTHEIMDKPSDFEKVLQEVIDKSKTIADFIPEEPIKVADMLINAEVEFEHGPLVKSICGKDKGKYNAFNISDLRQIAEHLLVYCKHNEDYDA